MVTTIVKESIQKTIDALKKEPSEWARIIIPSGTYKERVEIHTPRLILEGEGMDKTCVEMDFAASEILENGERRGTFRSYTMFVNAPEVILKNLEVRNSAGPRKKAEQAVALYSNGDCFRAEKCRISGAQDTLFVGPLPKKERVPNGFAGPGELLPRVRTRHSFKECEIRGDVDFIFGSGVAAFEKCRIISKSEPELIRLFENGEMNTLGYVCAPSTYEEEKTGFLFKDCTFESDNLPKNSVYLARPWRDFAKCVFVNCRMDDHIKTEGFHDWNKKEAAENCFFAECGSYGPGADKNRVSFAKILTEEEAKLYEKDGEWEPFSEDEIKQ